MNSAAIDLAFAVRRVVDLTHTLSEDFPTFDGKPHLTVEPTDTFARDGFCGNQWIIDEHIGTHLDAPIHFREGGRAIDALTLAELIVPAVVVDIRARAAIDPDACLTVDDLLAWEAAHGAIPDRSAVLMWSGWDERAASAAAYRNVDAAGVMRFPGVHPDAAAYLRDARDVAGIGVDTLSLDAGSALDYPTHRALLPHDRWGLENLTGLGALPPRGAILVVGVPKVRGGSGGPARVLALLP